MLRCSWSRGEFRGSAVRGSACQADCRVRGHGGTRAEEGDAAPGSSATRLRAAFLGMLTVTLPTRLLSSRLIQSEGAPVEEGDVNHPAVNGRRPKPRGEEEDGN